MMTRMFGFGCCASAGAAASMIAVSDPSVLHQMYLLTLIAPSVSASASDFRCATSETRQVRGWRVRMLCETLLVLPHRLQHRPNHPLVHCSDVVLLARIRLDIEDLGVAVH